MTGWTKNPGGPAKHSQPILGGPGNVIRPRGRRGAWQDMVAPCAPGQHKGRESVLAQMKIDKAWSRARTEANRRLRIGDPEVQPPTIAKPERAPGPLGRCDDDQDHLPPHKRQKRREP